MPRYKYDEGFYWVQVNDDDHWEPAQHSHATWMVLGTDQSFGHNDFHKIGEKIPDYKKEPKNVQED